jgi:glycosyltransferase involved in cell wall biosynthesis
MRLLVAGATARSLLRFRGPLLDSMVELGHEVHACAGEAEPATSAELEARGVRFHAVSLERSSTNPLSDLRYGLEVAALLRRIEPELVLSYTLKPAIFVSLAAQRCSIAAASMITGAGQALANADVWSSRAVSAAVRVLLRRALRSNDVVFFQNPDDLGEFVARKLVAREKAVLIAGSGIDVAYYEMSPPPCQPVTFLLMARLLRDKGVLEYADAARALAGKNGARFVLLGPRERGRRGLDDAELARCVRSGIEYRGEVEDVRPFLRESSVYVLPSYYREGQPRSILEALATGRAVVTTDSPGCRETVRPGVNGFLVSPRDSSGLVAALSRFIDDPTLIPRMGAESRKLAESAYDVHRVNATILDELGLRADWRKQKR